MTCYPLLMISLLPITIEYFNDFLIVLTVHLTAHWSSDVYEALRLKYHCFFLQLTFQY